MSILGKIVGQLESVGDSSSSGVLAQSKIFKFYNPAPPYYIILCKLEDGAYCKGGVDYYCHLNFDVFIKSTPDGDNNVFTAFGIATAKSASDKITNVSAVKLTYNGVEYAALKVEGKTDMTNYNFVFAEGSHPDVFQVVRGSAGATEDSGWLVFRNAVDFLDCTPKESTG